MVVYPGAIDTFPPRVADDVIPVDDYDSQNDSIIAIETELGTLPKGGSASVKARLDGIDSSITDKVAKSGDTMAGNLIMNDGTLNSPKLAMSSTSQAALVYLLANGNTLAFHTNDRYSFFNKDDVLKLSYIHNSRWNFKESIKIEDGNLEVTDDIQVTGNHDFKNTGVGRGIIVRTPDNTKSYRISVDNAGTVISTLV